MSNPGQFRPGKSGNPAGRPPRAMVRHDAAGMPSGPVQRSQIRQDSWTNPATGHGTLRDARYYSSFRIDVVTDIEALDLRRSEFLCKRIIEAMPEEALRRGWHLKLEDKVLAEEMVAYWDEKNGDEMLVEAAQKEREAGGAALFPVFDGAAGGDLTQPLDEGGLSTVSAIHLLEPRELYPLEYHAELADPQWSRPSVYQMTPIPTGFATWIGMQPIHASRLVIFPGARVTRLIQPGQRVSWGDSALTPVKTVLSDFGIAWGSAATLLQKHGKETWAVNRLADMLAKKDGLDQFDRHVSATQLGWSVLRMNVIDGQDKIDRSTGTLAGVHDLLGEFKQLVAAAAETPVSILMGTTSTALRTGDDDTRGWYATIQKYRKKRIHPRHAQLIKLMMLCGDAPTGGVLPKLWSIEYPPLWEPDEKDHAQRLYVDMQRAQIAITSGIASADDVAESFYGGDSYSGDIVINWERRAAQAKIDEEKAARIAEDKAAMIALGRTGGAQDPVPQDGAGPAPDPAKADPEAS